MYVHSMPRLDSCPYVKPKAVFEIAWFSKQRPDVITQIKWDISCKLEVNFWLPGI